MDMRDIEIYLTLYQEKNITRTAEKLYVSQPSLTKRIKRLEEEFQTTLIIRTSKGIFFTSKGEKLVEHFKKLNTQVQNIQDDMISSFDNVQGNLRVGVSTIFAHYKLPMLLQGFLQEFPKVDLSIQTDRSSTIFKKLISDEVSLGIVRSDFKWQGEKKLLSKESLCIAYEEDIPIKELINKPYIEYKTEPSLQFQINKWWGENFLEPPRTNITTSSFDTCLELVKRGIGWSILAEIGLNDFEGVVKKLYWKNGDAFERSTWLYYKEEYKQVPTVISFIEYIQKNL